MHAWKICSRSKLYLLYFFSPRYFCRVFIISSQNYQNTVIAQGSFLFKRSLQHYTVIVRYVQDLRNN